MMDDVYYGENEVEVASAQQALDELLAGVTGADFAPVGAPDFFSAEFLARIERAEARLRAAIAAAERGPTWS